MAEAAQEWAPPPWIVYNRKHRAKQGIRWSQVRERTRHDAAKYLQDFTDESQRELELSCVELGVRIEECGSVRSYYLQVNRIIGASEGEETNFVYAERLKCGDVHGCPITRRELQRLGVEL
jgi:hypothetical protein